MTDQKAIETITTDPAFLIPYYEHQYDRIAELEGQRQNFTNIVITLSVVAFTFGFTQNQPIPKVIDIALLAIIAITNLIAASYMQRTRYWIKTHRERAKKVLEKYANDLYQLDKAVLEKLEVIYKREENNWNKWMYKWFGGRGRIQLWLHRVLFWTCAILIIVQVIM